MSHFVKKMRLNDQTAVSVDIAKLASIGRIYLNDVALTESLLAHDIKTADYKTAFNLIKKRFLDKNKVILGVSGFTKSGFDYSKETKGLELFYKHIAGKLSLSIDGGLAGGILGLNAFMARKFGVPSLGVVPSEGLTETSSRSHMLVWGKTFEEREIIVSTLPDILICVGGKDGTRRECEEAAKLGSVIVILALKKYDNESLPNTYQNFSPMQKAIKEKRLLVCSSLNEIESCVKKTVQISSIIRNRTQRQQLMQKYLAA